MSKDKSNQPARQGKSVAIVETKEVPAVQVEVSHQPQAKTETPAPERQLTAKERLALALLESPAETTGRHKDNPVFRQLEEISDLLHDMKRGINGQPKRTTKQVVAVLAKAKIFCSTASLSNFYASKGWTKDGKRGEQN